MKSSLQNGAEFARTVKVDNDRTIAFMGEELRVYATPFMVRDVEMTCRELLLPHHDAGEDTVGARVEIDHLGPTLVGQSVTVSARVAELALPRVTFEVEVKDELAVVGRARHVRFVIDKEKQRQRLKKKAELVAGLRAPG